jgi:hypothetical protein
VFVRGASVASPRRSWLLTNDSLIVAVMRNQRLRHLASHDGGFARHRSPTLGSRARVTPIELSTSAANSPRRITHSITHTPGFGHKEQPPHRNGEGAVLRFAMRYFRRGGRDSNPR